VVKWFVNSKELIKSTKDFRIETPEPFSTQLVINEIFPEDEGEYTCSISNTHGTISTSTELTVYSAEAAPIETGSDCYYERFHHLLSVWISLGFIFSVHSLSLLLVE